MIIFYILTQYLNLKTTLLNILLLGLLAKITCLVTWLCCDRLLEVSWLGTHNISSHTTLGKSWPNGRESDS